MKPTGSLWHATAPPFEYPASAPPARVDVAVIGGGYTGLSAARTLARAGVSVAVLERESIGAGASGRNGGFVLPGFKAELAALVRRVGLSRARSLFEVSLAALQWVEEISREEAIDCHWQRSGSVTLAARPGHLRGLEAEHKLLRQSFGHETVLLDQRELTAELGSQRYHGGLLDRAAGALHPAKYLLGLTRAAARAGALLCERTEVRRIARTGAGFQLETSRGMVGAGEVLLATNGYSGRLVPWIARRVVPVGSFIIATIPLEPSLAAALIPRGRVLSDTKNLLYYFRLSPDRRLVFGGRAAFRPGAVAESLGILRSGMLEVFPQLSGTEVEFGWGGTLGFTLDHMPHAGRHAGVSYALGYCGHGVAMASWLGHQVGQALAGRGPWPLADLPFPAVPLHFGRPWFLPLAGAYYQLRDWLG